jgi:hypothetical protein
VQSYDKLDLPELRDGQRVLRQNFPQQRLPGRPGRTGRQALVALLVNRGLTPTSSMRESQLLSQSSACGSSVQLPHRRQRRQQALAVAHLAQPRVAQHQQAVIGLGADQPPGPCLSDTAASATK